MSQDDRPRHIASSNDALGLERHKMYGGKIQMVAKCPLATQADLAVWYTSGVAAPSRAIHANPAIAYNYANKGNTIAIVTNGSRVLRLGNIGPLASLLVMEGKALLFKHVDEVDAVSMCLDTQDTSAIITAVRGIGSSFGGINVEDIAPHRCFRVLGALRSCLSIPV